jgi:hypothetical protein
LSSGFPFDDVFRYFTKRVGLAVKNAQRIKGDIHQFVCPSFRFRDTDYCRIGCLSPLQVTPGVLADLFGRAFNIQNVVGDLESKPYRLAVSYQGVFPFPVGSAKQRAGPY